MAGTNDIVIKIATVNGTGSASANGLLRKAIFRMGVPVVGKNYFPSNIQGLPTWYEIRVTGDGYQSRSDRVDIMVAMNAQTYAEDLADVAPGGWLIYDSTWPRSRLLDREDINIVGIPFSRMCNEHFDGVRTRILMKNIAYVGALAALMDIDLEVIKELLEETFATKQHLIASNMEAIHLGYDYAELRKLRAEGVFLKQPIAVKRTRDLSIFRFITTFVRQKPELAVLTVGSGATRILTSSGSVSGTQIVNRHGQPIPNRYSFDLTEPGALWPGDVGTRMAQ